MIRKTLIVSSYAPPAIGGPQILYNLLQGIPEKSYCILTSFYNIDNLSALNGTWLAGKYIFYDNPRATRETLQERARKTTQSNKMSFVMRLKHAAKRLAVLRFLGGIPIILWQIILITRWGRRSVSKEHVQSLLAISDYGPALIGTYLIHKLTGKPFSIYFFDLYRWNFLPFPGGIMAHIFEPILIAKAQNLIVTNRGTKEFYQKKYGSSIGDKITVIYNPTFPEPYEKIQTPYNPKPPYTILFTGRISWPQLQSLKNLIQAVETIDLDMRLELYCPMPPNHLHKLGIKESKRVSFHVAPPTQMPLVQSKADILFIPLSWGTKSPEIIDTATPAKLTEYLGAGRPILVHAPASSHLVQYAKEDGFAHVVEEENIRQLQLGITKIVSDKEYSLALIKNARKVFLKNHDIHKSIKTFQSLLLT